MFFNSGLVEEGGLFTSINVMEVTGTSMLTLAFNNSFVVRPHLNDFHDEGSRPRSGCVPFLGCGYICYTNSAFTISNSAPGHQLLLLSRDRSRLFAFLCHPNCDQIISRVAFRNTSLQVLHNQRLLKLSIAYYGSRSSLSVPSEFDNVKVGQRLDHAKWTVSLEMASFVVDGVTSTAKSPILFRQRPLGFIVNRVQCSSEGCYAQR